jgi:hypothetical protein
MKVTRASVVAVAVAFTVAAPLAAQDFTLDPSFGTLNLSSGFNPDPTFVSVRAGGAVDASTANRSCMGFISSPPDVRLNYTSGSLPLIISAAASADTTLVVNAPDGTYYCDDDSGTNRINPMVRFNSPASGQYDIWVGTYANGGLQPARLYISEISSQ